MTQKCCSTVEPLEGRIAPATLYVAHPADYEIRLDVGAPGLSIGDFVSWNPGAGSGHPEQVLASFGSEAFTSIADALAAADAGDTIRVGPGTFIENLVVNKQVKLLGNQNGIPVTDRTGPETLITSEIAPAVMSLEVSGITVDGFQIVGGTGLPSSTPGIKTSSMASGYTIQNNIIQGGGEGTNDPSAGIYLESDGLNLTIVRGNQISGAAGVDDAAAAILTNGPNGNVLIEANRIFTLGPGIALVTGDPGSITIARNTIEIGKELPVPAGAIVVGGLQPLVVDVRENVISGDAIGVYFVILTASSKATVYSNSFSAGNSPDGPLPFIQNDSFATIDARYNWFETTDRNEIADRMVGNVIFEPFLPDGDDVRPDIAGFQSVPTLKIVKPRVATLVDVDGDLITITISKGTLTPQMFTVAPGSVGSGVQLQKLDLTALGESRANVTITAKRTSAGGDNAVNVGFLNATGVNLGKVKINGDLGRISAGSDAQPGGGVTSITVHSMGRYGLTTQGEAADLRSILRGNVGSIVTRGNIEIIRITMGTEGSTLGKLTIGGALIGGRITSEGALGMIKIKGDLASTDMFEGSIYAEGSIGNVTIGGSLIGSQVRMGSSSIRSAGDIGFVKIGGHIIGGAEASAQIATALETGGRIAGVTIGGSIVGGIGASSGFIFANAGLGPIKIGGDLRATNTDAEHTAKVFTTGDLASLFLGGSLVGGGGMMSGFISVDGVAGPITIKGNIVGGTLFSGAVVALTAMKSVSVGGSIFGDFGRLSGAIEVYGPLGPVKVGGSIIGGYSEDPHPAQFTGSIRAQTIAKVTIGGSLVAQPSKSTLPVYNTASIVADTIGPVVIGGDIIGTETTRPQIIAMQDGIASIKVGGNVSHAQILAGFLPAAFLDYDAPELVNAHARIGNVTVGGDWTASDLIAGVGAGDDKLFGTADDVVAVNGLPGPHSRIASIIIKGTAIGNPANENDHFGIVAQEIAKARIGGMVIPLTKGASNDDLGASDLRFLIGTTWDFRIHEVA